MANWLKNIGAGLGLGLPFGFKGVRRAAGDFLGGTPEKRENVSTLRPEQEALYNQLINAGMGPGAGGAMGDSADYYRNLLSDDSADYNAFATPAMRQYNEDIIPGLSEQFAGMGSGGLSSSGFRNAQVQGATDLSERLGQIRANLRQAGAQGLQNIGNLGLQNFSQNMVTEQGSPGFLSSFAPAIGSGIGYAVGGPVGGAIGGGMGSGLQQPISQMGSQWKGTGVGLKSSPYGMPYGSPPASPRNMPNFGQGTRYSGGF